MSHKCSTFADVTERIANLAESARCDTVCNFPLYRFFTKKKKNVRAVKNLTSLCYLLPVCTSYSFFLLFKLIFLQEVTFYFFAVELQLFPRMYRRFSSYRFIFTTKNCLFCNFPVFGHLEKAPFRTERAVEWPCCILKGRWVWWGGEGKRVWNDLVAAVSMTKSE